MDGAQVYYKWDNDDYGSFYSVEVRDGGVLVDQGTWYVTAFNHENDVVFSLRVATFTFGGSERSAEDAALHAITAVAESLLLDHATSAGLLSLRDSILY